MRREDFYAKKVKAATDEIFLGEDALLLKIIAKKPQNRFFKAFGMFAACAVIVFSVFLLQRFVFIKPGVPGEETGEPTFCPTGAAQTTQTTAASSDFYEPDPIIS